MGILALALLPALLTLPLAQALRPVSCTGTGNVVDESLMSKYMVLFAGVEDNENRTLRSSLEFDGTMMFQAVRHGGVDLMEFIVTAQTIAQQIAPANVTVSQAVQVWQSTWESLAGAVEQDSAAMSAQGDAVGANAALARAATYLQLSERFSNHFDPHALDVFNKSVALFTSAVQNGIDGLFCEPFNIPYAGTTLPGFWCPGVATPESGNKTTVLTVNGFDGSNLNMFWDIGATLMRRGHNVVMFEGPGQGATARFQGLRFVVEWENVVTAVLDWMLSSLPVDPARVVLWGRSFGGILAPRAFVHMPPKSFMGLVADGGVMDMFQNVLCVFPPQLQSLLGSNPAAFDSMMAPYLSTALGLQGMVYFGGLGFGSNNTLSGLILGFEPFYLQQAELGTGVASRPVLVNNPLLDTATNNQSAIFWEALSGATPALNPRSTLLTMDPKRGTGLHCDLGSTSNTIGAIMRWIESL